MSLAAEIMMEVINTPARFEAPMLRLRFATCARSVAAANPYEPGARSGLGEEITR